MTPLAQRCGLDSPARRAACADVLQQIRALGLQRVRIAWCDLHGGLRGKALMPHAVADAFEQGLGMPGTVMLKDSADRTAYTVFDAAAPQEVPGFEFAANVLLLPDPASFRTLPWSEGTGWLRAEPWFTDATPVPVDPRRALQQALARLGEAGYTLRCGLEVEFHIYRITDPRLDPDQAAWPGEPPAVEMIHPGFRLLSEEWGDICEHALGIVQRTALGLGLPLRSLEVELGPSQVEAVFDATEALAAADTMALFRSAVRQALRREGYHASFVCRPPFANAMASGWHLHHSLVDRATGRNAFMRPAPEPGTTAAQAAHTLSLVGQHWLAGLLAHGRAMTALCCPTLNAYGRFKPNALAPQAVVWGRDNRGAMLRLVGAAGDAATRIENRLGEPSANPYLYLAAQVHAGLSGLRGQAMPPLATAAPYAGSEPVAATSREAGAAHGASERLPTTLGEALDALAADTRLVEGFGAPMIDAYVRIKRQELARQAAATDPAEWDRREYFSRY